MNNLSVLVYLIIIGFPQIIIINVLVDNAPKSQLSRDWHIILRLQYKNTFNYLIEYLLILLTLILLNFNYIKIVCCIVVPSEYRKNISISLESTEKSE